MQRHLKPTWACAHTHSLTHALTLSHTHTVMWACACVGVAFSLNWIGPVNIKVGGIGIHPSLRAFHAARRSGRSTVPCSAPTALWHAEVTSSRALAVFKTRRPSLPAIHQCALSTVHASRSRVCRAVPFGCPRVRRGVLAHHPTRMVRPLRAPPAVPLPSRSPAHCTTSRSACNPCQRAASSCVGRNAPSK